MANVTIGALTKQATIINNEDNLIMYNATDGTQKITGTTLLDFIQNNLFYDAPSKSNLDENDFFLIRVQDSVTGNIVYKKLPFSTVLSSVNLIDLVNQYLDENPPDIKVSIEPQSYLGAGIEIIEDQDLNDYIQVGRYYNLGTTVDNIPSDIITPTEFNMIVEQFGDNLLRQTIRCYNDYTPYIRNISWTESEEDSWSQFDGESFDEEQQYYEYINEGTYRNIIFDTEGIYEDQQKNFSDYSSSLNNISFYIGQYGVNFSNNCNWEADIQQTVSDLTSDVINNGLFIYISGEREEVFNNYFKDELINYENHDIYIIYSQQEEDFFFIKDENYNGQEGLYKIATLHFIFPQENGALQIQCNIEANPLPQIFSDETPAFNLIRISFFNNQNATSYSNINENTWKIMAPHLFVNYYPVHKITEDESPQQNKTYYIHGVNTIKTYNYGDWKKMPVIEQQESNS